MDEEKNFSCHNGDGSSEMLRRQYADFLPEEIRPSELVHGIQSLGVVVEGLSADGNFTAALQLIRQDSHRCLHEDRGN